MKNNKHELTIKIEGKEWEQALDKSFNKKNKDIKIDGFRKGKAPRNVYEKKYSKESLYMDAVDFVLPDAFKRVIEEHKITPVIQPEVDVKSVDETGVEIIFKIITKPEVKIKKYKGLKVKKPSVKVTKEEVEQEISALQKQYSEIILKDTAIEEGDTAVINFEGFKDGVAFEGGKGENYPLEVGSKTFIPGFEEQLIGLKQNDEKEIEVIFPNDYPSEELKGQKVIFKVIINEVKTKLVPELNDGFFKDLDMEDVNNKDELYKVMEKELEIKKEASIENAHLDNILAAIAKDVKVDIPTEMITEEIHRMIHQFEDRLKMQGITLEQYCQITGATHEQFHEKFEDEAKKVLQYRLMIEEISKLEKIDVSKEEIKEETSKMAEKYQMTEEELLKAFGDSEVIKYDIIMRKTVEFLRENN